VDFKTTIPREEHAPLYGRQLHAYALAAENPAPGNLQLKPVSRLGLLCFQPTRMTAGREGVAYRGSAHWIPIPRDDLMFMAFLIEVADLLDRSDAPDPAPGCAFCAYLQDGVLAYLGSWLQGRAQSPSGADHPNRRPPHLLLVPPLGSPVDQDEPPDPG
jgi:hypothetical protein